MLITPIKEENILSEELFKGLFHNIEAIYLLNQNFLKDLEQRINFKDYKPYGLVADIALKYFPFFKIYSDYLNGLE